jgi:DNA-binding transcriptional LysR family regulator
MIPTDPSRVNDLAVQQLRSFCLVYERQSYSAAAEEIGLSVPTIWEQVRGLSRCYGAALFEKRGRRIYPTPSAELLYESLRPVLAGLDSTFELVREGGNRPHTLTLVLGVRMMLEELGAPLKRFLDRHPHVCLRVIHGDNKTAEQLIVQGEADLGLALEPGPGVVGAGVRFERAYEIDYLALFPEGHPLATKKTASLRDLVEYPLIVGHRGTYGRHHLEHALHRQKLLDRLRVAVETGNSAFTAACVRAGMGVGIMAGRAGSALTRDLGTRSLRRQLGQASIVLMWKNGRQLTRSIQAIREELSKIKWQT